MIPHVCRVSASRIVVFAERIEAHGKTALAKVPAVLLGDVAVRAARMRGGGGVQIVPAEGPDRALRELARTLRAFEVSDGGFFFDEIPARRSGLLDGWCKRAGEPAGKWIGDPHLEIILPRFKGDVVRGAVFPSTAELAAGGFRGECRMIPLGHLRTVPAAECAKGTFPVNLLSAGILARNYLEHLDPQWLRLHLAARFDGTDRDWEMDVSDFLRIGRAFLGKVVNLGARCAVLLRRDCGGRVTPGKAGAAMLAKVRAKADAAVGAYTTWRFADAVRGAFEIADVANAFLQDRQPWKNADGPSAAADGSAGLVAFRMASIVLAPVLPDFAERIARFFGEPSFAFAALDVSTEGRLLPPWESPMPNLDADGFADMVEDALGEEVVPVPSDSPADEQEILEFR